MSDAAEPGVYARFPAFTDWAPPFDPRVVDEFAARLDVRRSQVSAADLDRAVNVATRYAAVDTGAIEGLYTTNRGFTRTIATQTATWEAALAQHGESVAHSINDALAGYELVLDAVTERHPISEAWIRRLHEVLCASQETYSVFTAVGMQRQPLPKGVYKSMPNNPTSADTGRPHHYAPVDDTPAEMQRMLEQLRSEAFESGHPVVQAAYAHYAFVCVHPFADGNGRVSRALASLYLYRAPGVPLVVFADQKDEYLDALERADECDPRSFVGFIEQRVVDAVELVIGSLGTVAVPDVGTSVARIATAAGGTAEVSPADMNVLNARLAGLVQESMRVTAEELGLAPTVRFMYYAASPAPVQSSPPEGFRSGGAVSFPWSLNVPGPVPAELWGDVTAWIRREGSPLPEFRVMTDSDDRELDVNLREIHPAASELLKIKLATWAQQFLERQAAALAKCHAAALVDQGYAPQSDEEA